MQGEFIQFVYLILIILGVVMLANKLKTAYPILLVIAGGLLSLLDGFTRIEIKPDLVFFIFLPPLLYEAAWNTSWKEFWKWRRIITSFAFPIVILTSCVVAFASHWLIPGFTLALGFLLGGIVSPPDAVSATTILRNVKPKAPRSLVSIIEGESLLNDASSLIVFRFALAAIITGQFFIGEATASFFLVIIMGIVIGLIVGGIFYCIHRFLPVTPSIEIILTLATPYCMYYFAEHFHFSGVLAVVSGGLLLSSQSQTMLNYRSRIEAVNVWQSLVFVLNGLVFMLIGLQIPSIIAQLGDTSILTAIWYGLAISVILIITRLLCAYGAVVFTKIASRFIKVADANPHWTIPLIFGWAGMRGVVSLAAAFSIPLLINDGEAFPFRSLILFITFIVILVTLVFQGLTLPWLMKRIHVAERSTSIPEEEQEVIIQKKMAKVSLQILEEKYAKKCSSNSHLINLITRLELDVKFFETDANELLGADKNALKDYHNIYLELLDHQRKLLDKMNHNYEFDDEVIRKYLTLIDMEEFKLREKVF